MARRPAPIGHGSLAPSLGARDPRLRTNAQVPLSGIDKKEPFGVDEKGRATLRTKASAITDLSDSATLQEVISKVNEILRGQRDSEQMER